MTKRKKKKLRKKLKERKRNGIKFGLIRLMKTERRLMKKERKKNKKKKREMIECPKL